MKHRNISMTMVIWGIFFVALVVYLLTSLLRASEGDVQTVSAVSYAVENACTARGIVVRDETLLVSGEEYVDVRPADGEKVGVGQILALTCSDEEQLALLHRMDELEMSVSQLGSILGEEVKPSRAVEMDEEIVSGLTELAKQRSGGDLFGATEKISEIKSLIMARSVLSSSTESVQKKLDSLKSELTEVLSKVSGSNRITSATSGTFTSQTDGFEDILTPKMLETVTAADIEELRRTKQKTPEGAFGKFVNGTKWYYAAAMDYEDISQFDVGDTVQMRFLNGCGGDLKMSVERIDMPDKDGKSVIVLSCSDAMSDTIALRLQAAEIINETIRGIRVPKSALRVDENGKSGVYCVNGTTAVFRKADVIYDMDDYVLVAVNTDDTEHLRVGEKIIVGEKDLFEGKVVVKG